MSMAVRLAGFELRDSVGYAHGGGDPLQAPVMAWCYGSGFPKSMDVSKAIDKAAGVEGEYGAPKSAAHAGWIERGRMRGEDGHEGYQRPWMSDADAVDKNARQYIGGTDAARQWQGWGTALKPAWEPIILARKPLVGTVAKNVLEYGTGALNIDGCRVESESSQPWREARRNDVSDEVRNAYGKGLAGSVAVSDTTQGRFPANLIHDGSGGVLQAFPNAPGQQGDLCDQDHAVPAGNAFGQYGPRKAYTARVEDATSAARFFYCAKATRRDRHDGLVNPGPQLKRGTTLRKVENTETSGNNHPTVKPCDLMRYLCRLVTPPGGVVLDPFMGSGSTGKAAMHEGFRFVGIERESDYLAIARARIEHAQKVVETQAENEHKASACAQGELFSEAA